MGGSCPAFVNVIDIDSVFTNNKQINMEKSVELEQVQCCCIRLVLVNKPTVVIIKSTLNDRGSSTQSNIITLEPNQTSP